MYVRLTDAERARLIDELYDAMLKHLLSVFSSNEPIRASFLDVVRSFLSSNGITAGNRATMHRGLEDLKQQLDKLPFDPTKGK